MKISLELFYRSITAKKVSYYKFLDHVDWATGSNFKSFYREENYDNIIIVLKEILGEYTCTAEFVFKRKSRKLLKRHCRYKEYIAKKET